MSEQQSSRPPPSTLLSMFLKESKIVEGQTDNEGYWKPPKEILAEILDDDRWTREMLEDWLARKDLLTANLPAFTPDAERRALYLILLKKLEQKGKDRKSAPIFFTITKKAQVPIDTTAAQKLLQGNSKNVFDDDETPTQASFDSKVDAARKGSSLKVEGELEDVPLEEGEIEETKEDFEVIQNKGPLKNLY